MSWAFMSHRLQQQFLNFLCLGCTCSRSLNTPGVHFEPGPGHAQVLEALYIFMRALVLLLLGVYQYLQRTLFAYRARVFRGACRTKFGRSGWHKQKLIDSVAFRVTYSGRFTPLKLSSSVRLTACPLMHSGRPTACRILRSGRPTASRSIA